MLARLLRRWADQALRDQAERLQVLLAAAEAERKVLEAERDTLYAVVARDRERILAETRAYAQTKPVPP